MYKILYDTRVEIGFIALATLNAFRFPSCYQNAICATKLMILPYEDK